MTTPDQSEESPTLQEVLIFILHADDHMLRSIRSAFTARTNVRNEEKRLLAISQMYVGTKIRLNGNVSPAFLQYKQGVITDIRSDTEYVVKLDNPPSPKWSGTFTCQVAQLELA